MAQKASEERGEEWRHVRLLFEQSPNAIILFDPESWEPIEFNDQAAEFMGYTRDEFARLTITDLEVTPNPEETREHIERIRQHGGDVFEAFHRTKDGSPRHVVVSLRMAEWFGRETMLTIWHDITERKAAEQALRESEKRLASVLESAMDAIVILDDRFHITRTNPAAEEIFECTSSRAVGQPIRHFLPADAAHRLLRKADAAAAEAPEQGRTWAPKGLRARRGGGELFPVELTLSPFEVEGQRLYTMILRDVNQRRRAEAEIDRLKRERLVLREQLGQDDAGIVGESAAMQQVFSYVDKVAATDSTVLVSGETGTGKELIARAIHDRSVRSKRVMVTVNCAALPQDLLESELFGHEKGAFTGATRRKRGRFELADGGTLFLDEVGELAAPAQAKLLRVLQEGEIQRVGSEATSRVNVRLVAATNRDLAAMVEDGSFRSDLYYRLSVFPIRVPPLRERQGDLPLLIDHFASKYSRKLGKPLRGFDDDSLERLAAYPWPGNVRELQNIVERAAILATDAGLRLEDGLLGEGSVSAAAGADTLGAGPRNTELDTVVEQHLRRVLEDCGWVIEGPRGAAVRLGIKPSTLRFRMKKLGIARHG